MVANLSISSRLSSRKVCYCLSFDVPRFNGTAQSVAVEIALEVCFRLQPESNFPQIVGMRFLSLDKDATKQKAKQKRIVKKKTLKKGENIDGGELRQCDEVAKQVYDSLEGYFNREIKQLERLKKYLPLELLPDTKESKMSDDFPASPFMLKTWRALLSVSSAELCSYNGLASLMGIDQEKKFSRAVGMAMARNPIVLVVPCHRVLPESSVSLLRKAISATRTCAVASKEKSNKVKIGRKDFPKPFLQRESTTADGRKTSIFTFKPNFRNSQEKKTEKKQSLSDSHAFVDVGNYALRTDREGRLSELKSHLLKLEFGLLENQF